MTILNSARSIAVFRALQLGDLLCAVPALRSLRTAAPQARITLIGLPNAADFVRRFHRYVDELLPFPGAPGFPEQAPRMEEWPAFLDACASRSFDLAIQMHGSGEHSNAILKRLGASHCAGFVPAGSEMHMAGSGDFVPWPKHTGEILRNLALVGALGAPASDTSLELPIDEDEWTEWRALSKRHGLVTGEFVCIHAGARLLSRRWLMTRFAWVALRLARAGWRIVLTGAPDEAGLVAGLRDSLRSVAGQVIDLSGKTSLGVLAALLSECRVLVCNDTGVSHVAAAMRARSVVVACGSDTARWAPLDSTRHRVLAYEVPCRPCAHVECPIGHSCALGVTADMVLREVHGQMRQSSVREPRYAA